MSAYHLEPQLEPHEMFRSEPGRFGWDLSELKEMRFTSKRYRLNLSYSRLTEDNIRWVIGLLEKYDKLDVNLGFCGASFDEVMALLVETKHAKWFEEGRITMATTSLELNIEKFVLATNKRCKTLEDWQDVEDTSLEKEVTKAVKAYLVESGFTDVRGVPLKKIIGADANLLIELDGLLAATKGKKLYLITVESKHKVTTEKIEKRTEQNKKFEALLSELHDCSLEALEAKAVAQAHIDCCSVLQRYAKANAEVLHFMGGVHFSESDVNFAQKKKFGVVTREGDAFHVTPYGV